MVDTSGSQRNYITDEIVAGRAFFPAMLTRPADRAVLVQFDSSVLQLVKLTTNPTTLEHGLNYLYQSHDDIGPPGRGGTLLFDAICAVSKIELGNQMGRRAMVILTDGGDNGSRFSAKDAIRAAQGADIMIYSVYYSNGGGNLDVLNDLSKVTGGRVFTARPAPQPLPQDRPSHRGQHAHRPGPRGLLHPEVKAPAPPQESVKSLTLCKGRPCRSGSGKTKPRPATRSVAGWGYEATGIRRATPAFYGM
jgi:hypothetical protein